MDAKGFYSRVQDLNTLIKWMAQHCVPYGERAERLEEAMVDYEKTAPASAEPEETIVRGWSLIYYFREAPQRSWGNPDTLWHRAGNSYRDRVVRDRAEGKLGLPGSMTKPASRR
jgi:hypothetical protein